MDLQKKVALVIGASRGLGKASALALASEGADVLITYFKEAEKAQDVVTTIQSMGQKSEAFQVDVSIKQDVDKLANNILNKYSNVDILVNNAGAIIRPSDWSNLNGKDLDRTIDINLKGPIFCIQAFVPSMIEQKFGRIINVTTTYAITGAAAILVYAAAKAGVISVTYSMAKDLAQFGITVNAVAPGNFDTELTKSAGNAVIDWAVSTTPLKRLGQPHEIGEAIVYLAKSDFVTGHILVVDGGQILNI